MGEAKRKAEKGAGEGEAGEVREIASMVLNGVRYFFGRGVVVAERGAVVTAGEMAGWVSLAERSESAVGEVDGIKVVEGD